MRVLARRGGQSRSRTELWKGCVAPLLGRLTCFSLLSWASILAIGVPFQSRIILEVCAWSIAFALPVSIIEASFRAGAHARSGRLRCFDHSDPLASNIYARFFLLILYLLISTPRPYHLLPRPLPLPPLPPPLPLPPSLPPPPLP